MRQNQNGKQRILEIEKSKFRCARVFLHGAGGVYNRHYKASSTKSLKEKTPAWTQKNNFS